MRCGIGVLVGCAICGLLPTGRVTVHTRTQDASMLPLMRLKGITHELFLLVGGYLGRTGILSLSPVKNAVEEIICQSKQRHFEALIHDVSSALGALFCTSSIAASFVGFISCSMPLALLGASVPLIALCMAARSRAYARARALESAMPEAFGALAIALGSGHSLAQAMRFVGSHATEPVRSEFMRVSFSIDCGVSAADALDALLSRLAAPGLDLVALALKVSHRTGSPLKDLLSQAAFLVGERIELRRTLDVKTSQGRMSSRIVAGMPIAMICALSLLSADFRRGVTMPLGVASIGIALLLNIVALLIIKKIMDVHV